MCPFRSHIPDAMKVPEVFQTFCIKVAQLACRDSVDFGSIRSSFQRVYQKKQEYKKGSDSKPPKTPISSTNNRAKEGKETVDKKRKTPFSGGVGPLVVDPPSSQPPKKMKQTVRSKHTM